MSVTRSNLVFFFAGILLFAGNAFAVSGIARFVFVTDPQTISPGKLSGALQIQAQDANGKEIKSEETIDLEFSSSSLAGEFMNAGANPVSMVMSKGTANRTFYYRDSNAGVHTLMVKAQGRDSGTSWTVSQTITISSGAFVPSSIPVPVPTPAPLPSPPLPPSSSSSGGFSNAQINVDAGPDQTVAAGSLADFKGAAVGLKKEPLDTARFWWNFGDGETQEGKATTHVFRIPGTYIVGLHVSSGEYASSDYATVRVLANQMRPSRVVEGREGYIQLANPLNVESDIGGWIIEDGAGKQFFIPSKTKIAAGGELSLSNAVTGLLQDEISYPLTIQYPNGTVAFAYAPARPDDAVGRASTSSQSVWIPTAAAKSATSTLANKFSSIQKVGPDSPPIPIKANIGETRAMPATMTAGFSVSSRMMFAGAIGLSALGALGFFVLKHFLI